MTTVLALLMSCEACGTAVRIDRDDPQTFCAFIDTHYLPTIDQAEVVEHGATRLIDVEVTR